MRVFLYRLMSLKYSIFCTIASSSGSNTEPCSKPWAAIYTSALSNSFNQSLTELCILLTMILTPTDAHKATINAAAAVARRDKCLSISRVAIRQIPLNGRRANSHWASNRLDGVIKAHPSSVINSPTKAFSTPPGSRNATIKPVPSIRQPMTPNNGIICLLDFSSAALDRVVSGGMRAARKAGIRVASRVPPIPRMIALTREKTLICIASVLTW